MEVTSPAELVLDPMSGRDTMWGQHIRVLRRFLVFRLFFCFLFFIRATIQKREPIFAHNSSKDAVRCKKDPFRGETREVVKCSVV